MKDLNLLSVSKPTRYLGGEINSIHKNREGIRLNFALAFPDVYEVGMSHLGLQILYHILNQQAEVACERVFVPWPDMARLLRGRAQPLCTLESDRPLRDFDVVGFSLLYELNYTGVLNILDLAGIPRYASARNERDPLIIGGGPCTMNPEPLADFFDAFVLGDGEEVVLEICREILESRAKGEGKNELLRRLSHLNGLYIPSFFRVDHTPDGRVEKVLPLISGHETVRRRVLSDLKPADYPSRPVLPFMETIHDRLNIEVARGCTRGCRFCQAGMIYRPLRERSAEQILELVEKGLKSTGYEELSLLSLSTGDYSCIEPLLSRIIDRYGQERVAVSLPSLRTETLTPLLTRKIQDVRKTGFTLAPEAGSQRLRQVINKGNAEADLLRTIETVFSAGWRLIKLYFMIGLPTETEEDLAGIVQLAQKAIQIARRSRGSAQVNVSISTFIPKSHTPFQWEAQAHLEEVQRKQKFLQRKLKQPGIHLKWPDPHLSLLEGVFARGDRRLSRVLEMAYDLGCRLDGWGDHFRYDLWEKALAQAGVDPSFYAFRARDLNETLPWEHLESGITKKFLLEERTRAFQGIFTEDCRQGPCNGCGVCLGPALLGNRIADPEILPPLPPTPPLCREKRLSPVTYRYRFQFSKVGGARFFGHLELSKSMLRALRRAGVPLSFTQGFNPHPRVSFGPPIPVGYESLAEFMDLYTALPLSLPEVKSRMNKELPLGIRILRVQEIPLKYPSIFDNITQVLYIIRFSDCFQPQRDVIERYYKANEFRVFWARKDKSIDLRQAVKAVSILGNRALKLTLKGGKEDIPKPGEILDWIFGWNEERPHFSIHKYRVDFQDEPCPMKS